MGTSSASATSSTKSRRRCTKRPQRASQLASIPCRSAIVGARAGGVGVKPSHVRRRSPLREVRLVEQEEGAGGARHELAGGVADVALQDGGAAAAAHDAGGGGGG